MLTIHSYANGKITTSGLAHRIGLELQFTGVSPSLQRSAEHVLASLAEYFTSSSRPLPPGQTVDWASGLLIAREKDQGIISFDEQDYDGVTVLPGANNTIRVWAEQSEVVRNQHEQLDPCRFGEKLALSPGVLESSGRIEGVRYARDRAMSGWWIFTPEYDGAKDDFVSMSPTHTFHLLRARRDIARYLGLPLGYAFDTESGNVWFDADVAAPAD